MSRLLPSRARFDADHPAAVEVLDAPPGSALVVRTLGDEVARLVAAAGDVSLGPLAPGGHTVQLVDADGRVLAGTAVEVDDPSNPTMRYGFVVDFRPGREVEAVARNLRRLHLTDVQFYDWAYRHADLLGGGEEYDDALGQPVSLETVRGLVHEVQGVGARALGYAAVYAVGNAEWDRWSDDAMLDAEGAPYALGDFLQLVDPASGGWSAHLTSDLGRAVESVGFDGFHLDQYGYPKRARLVDGTVVDVEASFSTLLREVRRVLPDSTLCFNNVNDFPTWVTGGANQDAVYIEVWPPHVELGHLASVATRARSLAEGKPVVVAAYQEVYDSASPEAADLATSFTMATLFSHGATQLLCGEADRLLVDPYYVRNHVATEGTMDHLARWYDFLVAHGGLLTAPGVVDVTGAYAGSYNDDVDVTWDDLEVSETAVAGHIWRRVTRAGDLLVVHLINLAGQLDTRWDAPRELPAEVGPGTLRVRCCGPSAPRVRVADPDGSGVLVDVEVVREGTHASAILPPLHVWQAIVIGDDA
jgi:dextranase